MSCTPPPSIWVLLSLKVQMKNFKSQRKIKSWTWRSSSVVDECPANSVLGWHLSGIRGWGVQVLCLTSLSLRVWLLREEYIHSCKGQGSISFIQQSNYYLVKITYSHYHWVYVDQTSLELAILLPQACAILSGQCSYFWVMRWQMQLIHFFNLKIKQEALSILRANLPWQMLQPPLWTVRANGFWVWCVRQ